MAELYMKNIKDWREATLMLSFEEKGYFDEIISLIYLYDDRLLDDDDFICRAMPCNKKVHLRLKQKLLKLGLISVQNGFITNSRSTQELLKINSISKRNKDKAARRWSKPLKSNDAPPNSACSSADAGAVLNSEKGIEKDITKVISKKPAEKKPVKIPDKKGKSHAKPKRKTSIKTEFGENQRMPEKYRPVALEKGLHESWHNFEWGLFCDYWLGKGEGRVDWIATWRGWSARAINWDERKGSDKNTPSDRAGGSTTLDAVNELVARRSDQKRQPLRDDEAGF